MSLLSNEHSPQPTEGRSRSGSKVSKGSGRSLSSKKLIADDIEPIMPGIIKYNRGKSSRTVLN